WNSSAFSFVQLSGAGVVFGLDGTQQVGAVLAGFNIMHASLWSGDADSRTDLNPAGADYSIAYGVQAGQRSGSARFGGVRHAGYWTGSADSWTDLNPAAATSGSVAYGVDGAEQAGVAFLAAAGHASRWTGSAASWTDLNPAGATESEARGVS